MAASTSVSRRRATAHAQARAAKERKQKIFLGVALGLLVLLLVWELPKVLKHSSSSTPAATPAPADTTAPAVVGDVGAAPVTAKTPAEVARDRKVIARLSAHDVFGRVAAVGAEHAMQDVPAPAGFRDPFDKNSTGSASSTPPPVSKPATSYSSTPLPAQIVVGSAGAGKVADKGWIVILASIPTGKGRSSAEAFVRKANGKGIAGLSVLNSSNSRPLRGGYWVVYAGPFKTIAQVNTEAGSVHASGFGSAYVRQLVVYRAR